MLKQNIKTVSFNYLQRRFYFPSRTFLKAFLVKLFSEEGYGVEGVNYVFCSDTYLLKINQDHLNHDTLTDIITFQYSKPKEPVLSDIYISIDRVKENARLYDTTFLNELHRVIFHGALHLCGYSDKTEKKRKEMRSRENYYLSRFVPRGTK